MAHTNVQFVSGNLTTGGDDPTFYIDRVNNKVGIGEVPETSGDDSSNVLQVNGSMLATKYHGDGSSLTGLNDSKWLEYSGDASKIYYNGGNVGIGVDNPGSKFVVNGDIDIRNGNLKTNGTDANFATQGDVSTAVSGLATESYVDTAVADMVAVDANGDLTHNSGSFRVGDANGTGQPQFFVLNEVNTVATDVNDRALVQLKAGNSEHNGLLIDMDDDDAYSANGNNHFVFKVRTKDDAITAATDADTKFVIRPDGRVLINHGSTYQLTGDPRLAVNGDIYATGDVTASSDRRLKTDIKRIEGALDKVCAIGGYTYVMNDKPSTGLIAQEVREVLPEVVHGSEETSYSLAYGNIIGLLVEAIKELKEKIG